MSYAALLKALAENPHGVYADSFEAAAIEAAERDGLVRQHAAGELDKVVLTKAGRERVGLPPDRHWLRFFDG